MKKLLLLTGVSAISIAAIAADYPQPKEFEDVFFTAMSPNGKYVVSEGMGSIRIFNLESGESDDYLNEDGTFSYGGGIGKYISDNGIVVGTTDYMTPEYWKDGEWYALDVPDYATMINLANAITPDGSRICGSIGISDMALDGDALMQVPCIWNASGEGYGDPVILPYPEKDFTGRVPQYVTAVDISADGKTIVGQVRNATGMSSYPIVYKENENGEWSYEIVHPELLNPNNVVFPEWPGEGPAMPTQEQFMTPDEINEYNLAVAEWFESMGTIDYPDYIDYMSDAEVEAYYAAMEEYNAINEVWYASFLEWFDAFDSCFAVMPEYEFNSVRISPDGKTLGCTVIRTINNPDSWFATYNYNVWMFDIESGKITKYNQLPDVNLTYLGNDGVGLASTSVGSKSNSYVLHDGMIDNMYYWMSQNCVGYAAWMSENMIFDVITIEGYDEETWEPIYSSESVMMSGRAVGTPDLSVIALTAENTWNYETLGNGYIFDVKAYQEAGVEAVRPDEGVQTIYDLSGRKLKSADAPGIYIINGEKKVVR